MWIHTAFLGLKVVHYSFFQFSQFSQMASGTPWGLTVHQPVVYGGLWCRVTPCECPVEPTVNRKWVPVNDVMDRCRQSTSEPIWGLYTPPDIPLVPWTSLGVVSTSPLFTVLSRSHPRESGMGAPAASLLEGTRATECIRLSAFKGCTRHPAGWPRCLST